MTAQIPDTIQFEAVRYSLATVRGSGLFDPAEYGLRPAPRITSCWRGFVCRYAVQDDRLVLDTFLLNTGDPAPDLFGISPRPKGESSVFDAEYPGLGHLVPFTGRILAGNDFIQELYVHMGFHPAWKYRQVHQFEFSAGQLTAHRDRSAEAAAFRHQVRKQPNLGSLSIEETFRLDSDSWADPEPEDEAPRAP